MAIGTFNIFISSVLILFLILIFFYMKYGITPKPPKPSDVEIAKFLQNNPNASFGQASRTLNISKRIVTRVAKEYGMKSKYHFPNRSKKR